MKPCRNERNESMNGQQEGAAAPAAAEPLKLTEAEAEAIVLAQARSAIQAAGIKAWNQEIHTGLIARILLAQGLIDKSAVPILRALLGAQGLGGNASQFKQWLQKQKLLPEKVSAESLFDKMLE